MARAANSWLEATVVLISTIFADELSFSATAIGDE
jgi:hypothetical protein